MEALIKAITESFGTIVTDVTGGVASLVPVVLPIVGVTAGATFLIRFGRRLFGR